VKQRAISVGPRAAADIRNIGRYIAYLGAPRTARSYVNRLYDFVMRLDLATERGIDRNGIRQGLRIIPFENSATLALLVKADAATVIRVFYRGHDWERTLRGQFAKP
jgi:toxin ParE1/3/4